MRIRRPVLSLVVIGFALSGCGAGVQSEAEPATEANLATEATSTIHESARTATEDLGSAEIQDINSLPVLEGVAPFSIDQLVPDTDEAVLTDSSDDSLTVKSRSQEGEDQVIVISRGDVAIAATNHWACAWIDEYAQAKEANDEDRMDAAIGQLNRVSSLEAVQEFDPEVGDEYDSEIIPRLQDGDAEFASRYVQRNCASLTE